MQLWAEVPRDAHFGGEAERPRPAAPLRGIALTLGLKLFKAEVFSIFHCISEHLYSPLVCDAGQIPAYGFPGCWSAGAMILQGCNSRTHQGQVQTPSALENGLQDRNWPPDVAATGKDSCRAGGWSVVTPSATD